MMVVENLIKNEYSGGIKYTYSYRMVKSKMKLSYSNDNIEVQSYGIEVERVDIIDGAITEIERDCVKCISPDRHKVHNLLKMLYDYTVSPVHLVDVIGDYVDEYIADFDNVVKQTAII